MAPHNMCGNVWRHMAGPWFKKYDAVDIITFPVFLVPPNETQLCEYLAGRMRLRMNVRAASLRHIAGGTVKAHPPAGEGTEKQKKHYCRCRAVRAVHRSGGTSHSGFCSLVLPNETQVHEYL